MDMPIQVSPSLEWMIHQCRTPRPDPFPMVLLLPHEPQALANHGQTLERLRERGGLSAVEMLAVMEDQPLSHHEYAKMDEAEALRQLATILIRNMGNN